MGSSSSGGEGRGDSDGEFNWYASCPNGHGLPPAATVNISADVMMRIYVCPTDGYMVIRTSEGERSVYAPSFFMDRLDESRQRLSAQAPLQHREEATDGQQQQPRG